MKDFISEEKQINIYSDGQEKRFEYVDLGLPSGTMWAPCNVGADKPEDPGLLFQFAHIDGYKYGDKNNKFRTAQQNIKDTGNQYISKTVTGATYYKGTVLGLEDDTAHINMGGSWRMPTKDELDELINNTSKKVINVNGVKGMMFTSNINVHQLFIPFGGYWHAGLFNGFGSNAYIQSSQVSINADYYSYRLFCNSADLAYINKQSFLRIFYTWSF